MFGPLQAAIAQYLGRGYRVEEQFSATSVMLSKKRLFGLLGRKRLYLWVDGRAQVQASPRSFEHVVKQFSKNVRIQRALRTKLLWTEGILKRTRFGSDPFDLILCEEYGSNMTRLARIKAENSALRDEMRLRNGLEGMAAPLREEVENRIEVGYMLIKRDADAAFLRRPPLFGSETLRLCMGPTGRAERSGASRKDLQGLLDALISMFDLYRKCAPAPGRDKQVLDKQFEIDAEITALHSEMVYLGYSPNVGDFELTADGTPEP